MIKIIANVIGLLYNPQKTQTAINLLLLTKSFIDITFKFIKKNLCNRYVLLWHTSLLTIDFFGVYMVLRNASLYVLK